MAQTFAAVHSSTVTIKERKWGPELAAENIFVITFSTTLENALLHDRRYNLNHSIYNLSLLCRKDVNKLPNDQNPNTHLKCTIL